MATQSRPRMTSRSPIQSRARWARTGLDFAVNSPDGFPSAFAPGNPDGLWWIGSDQWPAVLHREGEVEVIPAVTRLTGIITDPLSSVPWRHVEQGFGGQILPDLRWINDPCLLRADARMGDQILPAVLRLPRGEFWATFIRVACWFGCSGLILLEDETGAPQAGSLRTLHPQFLRPVRDDRTETLVWEIGESGNGFLTDRDGYFQVGDLRWRLVVLRDPHAPIDVDGHSIGLFERHASTFGLAGDISTYATSVYRGNGVPNGILKVSVPGLTQAQTDEIKSKWMSAHGDSRGIGVLNSTTDFVAISRSPVDTSMIEGHRANLADLALCFCLDPNGALGISMGNSGTYVNEQAWFARLKTDLLPWIVAVEEVISSLLPVGRGIRMDFSELERPDPKTQYEALKTAVDAGLLTIDEARNVLGLPSLPEPPAGPEPDTVTAPAPVPELAPAPEPVRSSRAPTWLRHEA